MFRATSAIVLRTRTSYLRHAKKAAGTSQGEPRNTAAPCVLWSLFCTRTNASLHTPCFMFRATRMKGDIGIAATSYRGTEYGVNTLEAVPLSRCLVFLARSRDTAGRIRSPALHPSAGKLACLRILLLSRREELHRMHT